MGLENRGFVAQRSSGAVDRTVVKAGRLGAYVDIVGGGRKLEVFVVVFFLLRLVKEPAVKTKQLVNIHGNLRVPPLCHPPQEIRPY